MLGKLIKYEMMYSLRRMLPFYLGCIFMSFIVTMFNNQLDQMKGNPIMMIIVTVLMLFFGFGMMIMNVFVIVTRFSKSCFSTEGYLTFTIPATKFQVLMSKLLSAALLTLGTAISYAISAAIFIFVLAKFDLKSLKIAFDFIGGDYFAFFSPLIVMISIAFLSTTAAYAILAITNSKVFIRNKWVSEIVLTLMAIIGYNVFMHYTMNPIREALLREFTFKSTNAHLFAEFIHYQRMMLSWNLSASLINTVFGVILLFVTLYFLNNHLNIEGNE